MSTPDLERRLSHLNPFPSPSCDERILSSMADQVPVSKAGDLFEISPVGKVIEVR